LPTFEFIEAPIAFSGVRIAVPEVSTGLAGFAAAATLAAIVWRC
jgi:hypothetical protein